MPYVFGAYHLDPQRYELHHAGVLVPLRPKVFQVLAYLVAQHDRVVGKEELLEALWPGQFVGDVGLNTYIMEVRKALGDRRPPHQYLRTVHGQGYRFVAPVEVQDHALPPSPRPSGPLPVLEVPTRTPPAPAMAPTTMGEVALAEPPRPHVDGEYKPLSVLCGGLRAAAVLTPGLGPEGLYRVVQTVVVLAHEVIQAYGGTLTQQAPEGFTAVFGVPVAQEDHARRAVLAALDLQQRLAQHPTLRPPALGAGLALGIGIHSGLGVVGEMGPVSHRQVTVVGAPAQGALRLQQQAAPGALLVSAATYHLVQEEVRGEPCGSLALEGWQAPLRVYAVQGLMHRHAGVPRRPFRSGSPFVGRQRELALLHDRVAMVRAGAGQVLSLMGPPGIGKSRLLTELRRQLPPEQVTWYTGQCLAYGQTLPYLPVRDIVQQVCALAAGDPLETRTAAVRRGLARLGRVAEEDVALLLQVLDLPVASESLVRLSPEARQARTFTLLWHLLLHEAQQRPLVLVVEDVHWIDPTSEAWLTSLVNRLAGTAVQLLMTQRPGYQAPWGTHAAVTQLALPPLRAEDSQAVVAAVPGTAHLPAAQCQQLVAYGAGNPFFLEELAWHAVEHGRSSTLVPLPETVHAVVAARLDRLPAEAKALLQTAAVIGPEVPVPLLQALTTLPEEAMQRCLAHLQVTEFLYETRLFPEQEYTFKHALTHEVAYGGLLQERRRVLHARIVEALERLAGDRLTEQVEQLAHHALQGEVWDKALAHSRQAGEKAFARSAYREAVVCWEQALEALAHLPPERPTLVQAVDLRCDLSKALLPLAQWEQRLTHMRAAEPLAEGLEDQRRLGRVYRNLANILRNMHDYEPALAYCQRLHPIATALGDVELQFGANVEMGWCSLWLGDYRQSLDYWQQTLTALHGQWRYQSFRSLPVPPVLIRTLMVWCLSELGAFADGVAYGDEALQVAEADGRPLNRLFAYNRVGHLHVCQGTLHQAIPVLEQAVALSQDTDMPNYYPGAAANLALAYALAGRTAGALAVLGQLGGNMSLLAILTCGEAYLRAGCAEEAHRLAQQGLTYSRERKRRGQEAQALWLHGKITMHGRPPDMVQAEVHYQQALTLAEALGMRPLQAHCHLGLGTLYAKAGRPEQARTALSTAIALYRTMDMAFWLPQAEAALAQVEG